MDCCPRKQTSRRQTFTSHQVLAAGECAWISAKRSISTRSRTPTCRAPTYEKAKAALLRIQDELNQVNPSAARSLEEGMEETLTVHRLRVPAQLRRTLASTNVIESAFSIVETVCRNVKRWRAGDHIERWIGSGLLVAERQFRKAQGYREIPALLTSMANTISKKGVVEAAKVA